MYDSKYDKCKYKFLVYCFKKRLHIKLRRKKALRATKKVLNPNKSSFLPNLYVFGFDLLLIAFFLCNFFRTLCDQHSLWNGFQKKVANFDGKKKHESWYQNYCVNKINFLNQHESHKFCRWIWSNKEEKINLSWTICRIYRPNIEDFANYLTDKENCFSL